MPRYGGSESKKMPEGSSKPKLRKSGIPTGNSGEYFVMGELLRRGFDAQLADRNTTGYDILVGGARDTGLRKVQVKSARIAPWYVRPQDFEDGTACRVTIYVLVGPVDGSKPVRYFITLNKDLKERVHKPPQWHSHGFMDLKSVLQYEDRWDLLML